MTTGYDWEAYTGGAYTGPAGQGQIMVRPPAPMAYDPDNPVVYMGEQRIDTPLYKGTAARTMRVSDVQYFELLSNGEQQLLFQMMDSYIGPGKWNPQNITADWTRAVDIAAQAYSQSGIRISPFEVFQNTAAQYAAYLRRTGQSPGGGGGSATVSSVSLTNEGDARTVLNQAMTAYLGRQASSDEIDEFVAKLNEQERANPVVQTQSESSVVRTGGFNPSTFAEDFARSQEGSAEFTAATSLLDSFIGALTNPVDVI